jgi:hypothetical protein
MHIRVREYLSDPPDMKGGCTVLLDGSTENTSIQIRIAFCHPHDVFCKAKGRIQAETADVDVVPLRMLPGVLGVLWKEVHKRSHVQPKGRQPEYDCRIRDFLPKK